MLTYANPLQNLYLNRLLLMPSQMLTFYFCLIFLYIVHIEILKAHHIFVYMFALFFPLLLVIVYTITRLTTLTILSHVRGIHSFLNMILHRIFLNYVFVISPVTYLFYIIL